MARILMGTIVRMSYEFKCGGSVLSGLSQEVAWDGGLSPHPSAAG